MLGKGKGGWVGREPVSVSLHGGVSAGEEEEGGGCSGDGNTRIGSCQCVHVQLPHHRSCLSPED